jgi:mono/diheme cytochrome c family protein
MITNLFILFSLLAAALGLGTLTYRAIRAQRNWVRIAGGLVGGVSTLLVLLIAGVGGAGMVKASARHNPPLPPNLQFEHTPERIARGEYIVNISCVSCHRGTGDRQLPLTGGTNLANDIPLPVGNMIASNISPDGQIKDYTDAELFRAIRHGIRRDGARLTMMSLTAIREYSDEDVKSIIAYLRAQPPANSDKRGGDSLNFVAMLLFGAGALPDFTPAEPSVGAPSPAITPAYGKYVATLGDCRACHGSNMTGTVATAALPGAPNPRPYVAALSLGQFRQMMRTGVRPTGGLLNMPWENARSMSDDDLAAVYAYLNAEVKR